ncbi:hypothetical protein VNO78_20012 [Psophocarpus tetragonolobus]|uniref:Uncharacterized protein n=1 Tax=Psophocarpus tetragonolobus TaxID=3891 RepID=A0AAN9SAI8_PSOTE
MPYNLKEEIHRLARKFDLPNKDRKNSQGTCFLGKGNGAIVVDEPEVTRDHFYGRAYLLAMPLGYPTKADMQASGLVISASLGGPAYRTSVSSVMLSWQLMIQAKKTWDEIIRCS